VGDFNTFLIAVFSPWVASSSGLQVQINAALTKSEREGDLTFRLLVFGSPLKNIQSPNLHFQPHQIPFNRTWICDGLVFG
jgi:hypothetical protein